MCNKSGIALWILYGLIYDMYLQLFYISIQVWKIKPNTSIPQHDVDTLKQYGQAANTKRI